MTVEALRIDAMWIDGEELPIIGGMLMLNAAYMGDPREPKSWALDATVDGSRAYEDGQDVEMRLIISDGRQLSADGWVYRCEDASTLTTLLLSGGGRVSRLD